MGSQYCRVSTLACCSRRLLPTSSQSKSTSWHVSKFSCGKETSKPDVNQVDPHGCFSKKSDPSCGCRHKKSTSIWGLYKGPFFWKLPYGLSWQHGAGAPYLTQRVQISTVEMPGHKYHTFTRFCNHMKSQREGCGGFQHWPGRSLRPVSDESERAA